MNTVEEILEKASSRIKNAKRVTGKKNVTDDDVATAIKSLLSSPHLSQAAKKQLKSVHEQAKSAAQKTKIKQESERLGDLKVDEVADKKKQEKADIRDKIKQHAEEKGVTQIKRIGGEEPKQVQRSKSAEKLTGGVKRRLATGEGIAIRNKTYGQALDAQRKLKENMQQIKEAKGPEIIRASGAPEIPDEHADDPTVVALMDARSKAPSQEHQKVIDEHINDHISKLQLQSKFKKSSDQEQLVFSARGQWIII